MVMTNKVLSDNNRLSRWQTFAQFVIKCHNSLRELSDKRHRSFSESHDQILHSGVYEYILLTALYVHVSLLSYIMFKQIDKMVSNHFH